MNSWAFVLARATGELAGHFGLRWNSMILAALCLFVSTMAGVGSQLGISAPITLNLNGSLATFGVGRIGNYGSTTTGSLALQLWACDAPFSGGFTVPGDKLCEVRLAGLQPGSHYDNLIFSQPMTMPAPGIYNVVFVLAEQIFAPNPVWEPQALWNYLPRLGIGVPTGSLTVNLSPAGSIGAGAQWFVDEGPWQGSGATLSSLPPGSHIVGFVNVPGFVTPQNQNVTITANQTTVANGIYLVPNFTITLAAVPASGGSVAGGGSFASGSMRTVTATPNTGYTFANWTENGAVVSTATAYSFTLQGNRTLTANFLDVQAPTIKITAPTSGQRFTNTSCYVSGTATDNVGVAAVFYRLNGSSWSLTTGTNNWSALVGLMAGTNSLSVYAVDTSGNSSPTNAVNFQYVVTSKLDITATGLGTLSPNYSNSLLEIGRSYNITATPASGFICTNWTISTNWIGGVTTKSATVQFMMASNLTLQVDFVDVTRPTLAISSPVSGQHMNNALATVVGTSSDNWKVLGVWCQLNNGAWGKADTTNGWTNWTTTQELVAGTNTIKSVAMDVGGNYSTTISLNVVSTNTFKLKLGFDLAQPLVSNGLSFILQTSLGLNGHIQVSTNLINWVTLTNFVGTNSTLNFHDKAVTNYNRRYYRAVIP